MIAPIQNGLLRRRLNVELMNIQAQIDEWEERDEMTVEIEGWRGRFTEALRLSPDTARVHAIFTHAMQELLTDPITQAPIEQEALYGSDGHTYGRMSLAIYRHLAPEPFGNRSPIDRDNPAILMTIPHPVVRHMIQWLRGYNAYFFAAELEEQYREIVEAAPVDQDARIARALAEQEEINRREAEERGAARARDLARLDERLGRIAPARQPEPQPVPDLPGAAGELQRRMRERLQQGQQAFQRQQGELAELQAMGQEIRERLANAEDRAWVDQLRERLERIPRMVDDIAGRVNAFNDQMIANLAQMQQRDQDALRQLVNVANQNNVAINRLREENRALEQEQRNLGDQIDEERRVQIELQQATNETLKAAYEKKDRSFDQAFKFVLIAGACAFGTWALQSMLKASALATKASAAFVPTKAAGTALRFTVGGQASTAAGSAYAKYKDWVSFATKWK